MKIITVLFASLALASTGCGADSLEESQFGRVDGFHVKGQFIDLNTNGTERLYIRYIQIADSGVELERTTNNVVLWRAHVKALGVEHSLYNQDVSVWLEGEKIQVVSVGARTIHETRELKTGKLISRTIEGARK